MTGKIIRQAWITRADVKANPTQLYLFGDNIYQKGLGGQVAEMRGEVNTVGIPTKWYPGRKESDYFTDSDLNSHTVAGLIDYAFVLIETALQRGLTVVIPQDGIGTGLAELPRIYKLIQDKIKELECGN